MGGIHSASDAIEKIEAGAKLVQLYTGFIYEDQDWLKINRAMIKMKTSLLNTCSHCCGSTLITFYI